MKNILKIIFILLCLHLVTTTATAGQVVLFDQGHGQRFLVEKGRALDLSRFADLFVKQGFVVKTTTGQLSDKTLSEVDTLIISGPFSPITTQEVSAVSSFLHRGGKLVVMAHIHQPLFGLLERLGTSISRGPVIEQENFINRNPKDFRVVDIKEHPITKEIESFNIYGGWGVVNLTDSVQVLAQTSEKAWIDLDRNRRLSRGDSVQSFPVVLAGKAGQGKFVIFGDDAIFQNRFLKEGNLKLAQNLVNWLCCYDVAI